MTGLLMLLLFFMGFIVYLCPLMLMFFPGFYAFLSSFIVEWVLGKYMGKEREKYNTNEELPWYL